MIYLEIVSAKTPANNMPSRVVELACFLIHSTEDERPYGQTLDPTEAISLLATAMIVKEEDACVFPGDAVTCQDEFYISTEGGEPVTISLNSLTEFPTFSVHSFTKATPPVTRKTFRRVVDTHVSEARCEIADGLIKQRKKWPGRLVDQGLGWDAKGDTLSKLLIFEAGKTSLSYDYFVKFEGPFSLKVVSTDLVQRPTKK